MSAPSFGILFGLTNSVVRPSTKRSAPAIKRRWREIRSTLSGAIADEQLVLQQQRLCGDGADATWAEQLCDGDQQVGGEDEEVAHVANVTHHC